MCIRGGGGMHIKGGEGKCMGEGGGYVLRSLPASRCCPYSR